MEYVQNKFYSHDSLVLSDGVRRHRLPQVNGRDPIDWGVRRPHNNPALQPTVRSQLYA